ncbi:copper resistance system multicopper oxidase [Pseudomonas vlassakiae]|jgi:CopA family copper-resistance protein|uniref:copper resistance system multicopper oxidase n=1 Tax=Pseudomonas TaxID=286 RepID=UPI000C18D4EA|nr:MULTISPECIES: copper resistance system multicopper oxidase [unclassified Pseudomonas]AXQ47601.1 copper resistance system multicopper oxidase [Stenotrophomonas rhizophila]MBS3184264.1 copper resistance system multicopper oxidase [Pseudomonas sp. PCH44]PIK76865.1 copper oxidase [Pseudomonas sp. 382]
MLRNPTRRTFVKGLGAATTLAGLGLWRPLAQASDGRELAGQHFELFIGQTPVNITGRPRTALTINGSLPGPLLRWREGDTVTLRVRNRLDQDTSIHWHGILLPANMDGVPGLSFAGIAPGGDYLYRFTLRQSGTYWYHSHSGLQEQAGVYGAIVIEPREPEPHAYQRDHVLLFSDWSDQPPEALLATLKKQSDAFNYHKRTLGDFFTDVADNGWGATVDERLAWARMRMSPTDLADISAASYTYLLNGQPPDGNFTCLFQPGETVRLRLINASAMTYFDFRIPGLTLTVIAADGLPVTPVTVDEIRIAVAETYDVLVTVGDLPAYTLFAQSMDRSGYARGTLARANGLQAAVPAPDPRPVLSMADMGHGNMAAMDHGNMAGMDHASMSGMQGHPTSEAGNPLVDMQTMAPRANLADPGIGLRDNGRRVLTYADLRSPYPDPDGREPSRDIELHLTGHMERFAWSFDGVKFSDAAPLRLAYGERVRITLVNDTMMTHPIHLHGMWSDLEDEHGRFLVRKHTVDIPPGSRRSYRVTADALGRWAYHCHLLYHMETGMFREVRVDE